MKKYSIGKLPNNDIIYDAGVVSRMHADILVGDDGSITLIDHSKNGTMVNGTLIHHSSRPIRRGDNIVFANAVPLDWSRISGDGGGGNGGSGTQAPNATAALVLGILSLVIPYAGLVLGIVGWCIAQSALNKIKNNLSEYQGVGKLKAGLICSIISVGLYSLGVLIGIIAIAA